MSTSDEPWLALAIGNSHLHWGLFAGDRLHQTWNTPHLSAEEVNHFIEQGTVDFGVSAKSNDGGWWMVDGEQGRRRQEAGGRRQDSGQWTVDSGPTIQNPKSKIQNPLPLHVASVVPTQSQLWATYPHAHFLRLSDVPIQGMYDTFGIDRALTLWAAILTVGSPVLVIDAGTALTFTAADPAHTLIGGAILPGLRLQLESLGQNTALPPQICRDAINRVSTPNPQSPTPDPRPPTPDPQSLTPDPRPPTPDPPLPSYWNLNTPDAIASGILHTLLAGIRDFLKDWWQQYPDGRVVMTGGDGDRFYQYLITDSPELAEKVSCDRALIFKGIQAVVKPLKSQGEVS